MLSILRTAVRRLIQISPHKVKMIVRYILADKYGRKHFWAGGNYTWVYPFVKDSYEDKFQDWMIVEIGSRDCLDACDFVKNFSPKKVLVFEPSRSGLTRCNEVLKEHSEYSNKIILFGFALGKQNGVVDFFEFNLKDKFARNKVNIGSSSLGDWVSDSLPEDHRHKNLANVTTKYEVPIFAGDSIFKYHDEKCLLTCIDVEGFEFDVISGMKQALKKTLFVCVELSYNLNRTNVNYDADDVHNLMIENNFEIVFCDTTNDSKLPKKTKYVQVFNALYKNLNF